jgi:enamine deaminase RidA (YjgF/YER057c/UK114 family)
LRTIHAGWADNPGRLCHAKGSLRLCCGRRLSDPWAAIERTTRIDLYGTARRLTQILLLEKKAYDPPGLPPAQPRYSHIVRVSARLLVFVAGQVSRNSKGEVVGKGDFEVQAEQVFKNIQTALRAEGATFRNVVRLDAFVVPDLSKAVPILRKVRAKYIPEEPPASATIGVRELADPALLLEVEVVAAID